MEVKKEDLDRIVITSNEQMQKIIDWHFENVDYIVSITNDQMPLPMWDGVVRLEGEEIEFEFHDLGRTSNGDWVRFVVYMKGDLPYYVKVYSVEIDMSATYSTNIDWDKAVRNWKVYAEQGILQKVAKAVTHIDNTIGKIAFKWAVIMEFMVFNETVVEIDHSQDQPRTRRVARAMKIRSQPMNLVRKTYVIKDFDEKKLRIPGQPRKWTAPDREVAVRGHYRHLKSGKVVWVRECTKFKEKGNRKPKEWKM